MTKTISLYVSCLFVLICAGSLYAQLDFSAPEVDSALSFIGLTQKDFEADRIWVEDDTFLLSNIRDALKSPQAAYHVGKTFSAATPVYFSDAGQVASMAKFIDAECSEATKQAINARIAAAPPTFSDPFEPMLTAFNIAEGYRKQAFAKLPAAEQNALVLAAPLWFADEEDLADDSLKGMLHRTLGATVDTTQKVTSDSVLTLLALVDRNALANAVYAFTKGLTATVESWKHTKSPFMVTPCEGVQGLVLTTRDTPYGKFVLGGSGSNIYEKDFAMIIDLGGDDRYNGRVGCAVGGVNQGLSAVIDLSGNDLYIAEKNADQACGVLGIGAVVDVNGNDTYRAGAFSQGASFCGAGLFFDLAGDDIYQGGIFSQAASVCGISLFIDESGRDVYDGYENCQGFASTFACAALVDGGGNDVYRAGGLLTHAPLRPEDYRSMAQGFSIGSRPRAGGGIALLHDLGGNDFYNAEIYAQGVGYWYSLGCLIDEGGNDAYNSTQYCQGAGIHLAAGVLEDLSGDDRYASRFGPGQGAGHDLSVGLCYDHKGDDQYILSGGQGMAITNSAALFFDASGNDSYNTTEPGLGQGGARAARDFGSLSLFVDGEGHDNYSVRSESDSSLWFQSLYGIGYDVALDRVTPREANVEVTLNPADTLRPVDQLFKEAALWEVTDNREKVKRARLALNAKGMEAVHWVGKNKMKSVDALERRAIIDLFKQYPDSSALYLFEALNSTDKGARKNAIAIFGEMKYRPAAKALMSKLEDTSFELLRPSILTSLGDIKDAVAVPTLINYAKSQKERERIAATSSLGKIGVSEGWDAIMTNLTDKQYTVRSAALYAITAQGSDIISALKNELSSREEFRLEQVFLAIAMLGEKWQNDEKLKGKTKSLIPMAEMFLDYPSTRVQGAAILACAKTMDEKSFSKIKTKFEKSNDPVLLARLRQAKQSVR